MALPSKYNRPLQAILESEYVRLEREASLRYPFSSPVLQRLKRENRITVYGSPATIRCVEFEAAMKAGFPILKQRHQELLEQTAIDHCPEAASAKRLAHQKASQ